MTAAAISPDQVLSLAKEKDAPRVKELIESISEYLKNRWRGGEIIVTVKDAPSSVTDEVMRQFRASGWSVWTLGSTSQGGVAIDQFKFKVDSPQIR